MKKPDPTYQTEHRDMSLKDFRLLFHGCDVRHSIFVEVDGKSYKPVAVVEQVSRGRILLQLELAESAESA